ncbi:2-hydroxy-3-oxopropionate reductase [Nocardia cerradoensis]|uniref:2-hydroxy-3-oxopropionate reductase n=1 Tax=Nocardia cerradoensis TaxID=85688 RepID=A0A231HBS5_9NOCA|nr:NAD(P)-binding domain-containing protein [Nocardia cerradoensis]OXR46272.1 2-hydroxy-3-oxopropionate reductase [Nocardia cerradoensis]
MTANAHTTVAVLGLGPMGRAVATVLTGAGNPTAVWNRTPGKDSELVALGAVSSVDPAAAIDAAELVLTVLSDHSSVHQVLDPVADRLRGKALINLTSTAPDDSRELGRWAAARGIDFLDGGIMAVPPMIGGPGASILYSGSAAVFERFRTDLEKLATAEYFGEDAGTAALLDFALLAGMYAMFTGFFHGTAMVRSAEVTATEFAPRAAAYVTAMAALMPAYAAVIDSGDYTDEAQPARFHKRAFDAIVRASRDAGVALDVVAPIKNLIDRMIADGRAESGLERIVEELAGSGKV